MIINYIILNPLIDYLSILLTIWSSISGPETTKSWGIHLFLQKIAWICIMDIWVILKFFN